MLLVIFICIVIIFIILTLKIKLIINIDENKFDIVLKIYILKKILIWKIDLVKRINKKRKKSSKIVQKENKNIINLKKAYNLIKKSSLNIEKFNLKVDICTADAILTTYLVAILSNLIIFILKKSNATINYNNCKYRINPIYKVEKIFNLKFNCIISTNNVHSIYIIYKNFRKRRYGVNERKASNRKSYANSNEQHKRNG